MTSNFRTGKCIQDTINIWLLHSWLTFFVPEWSLSVLLSDFSFLFLQLVLIRQFRDTRSPLRDSLWPDLFAKKGLWQEECAYNFQFTPKLKSCWRPKPWLSSHWWPRSLQLLPGCSWPPRPWPWPWHDRLRSSQTARWSTWWSGQCCD